MSGFLKRLVLSMVAPKPGGRPYAQVRLHPVANGLPREAPHPRRQRHPGHSPYGYHGHYRRKHR
ncbi:hypothetical protein ACWKSP_04885 [Micromonosporaceae bacterium Da 78-11]